MHLKNQSILTTYGILKNRIEGKKHMEETKGLTMEEFVERSMAAFRKWQDSKGDLFRCSWTTKPFEMKCPQILLDMKRLTPRQDDWFLRLSVPSVDDPGYMVENFLKRGTYEEVVAYMESPAGKTEVCTYAWKLVAQWET